MQGIKYVELKEYIYRDRNTRLPLERPLYKIGTRAEDKDEARL